MQKSWLLEVWMSFWKQGFNLNIWCGFRNGVILLPLPLSLSNSCFLDVLWKKYISSSTNDQNESCNHSMIAVLLII